MDLRAALTRLRALLSRESGGRPRERSFRRPPPDPGWKMHRPGRDYADKMRRWREDK